MSFSRCLQHVRPGVMAIARDASDCRVEFQVTSRLSARRCTPVPLISVRATWLRSSSRDSRPVRALRCVGV